MYPITWISALKTLSTEPCVLVVYSSTLNIQEAETGRLQINDHLDYSETFSLSTSRLNYIVGLFCLCLSHTHGHTHTTHISGSPIFELCKLLFIKKYQY